MEQIIFETLTKVGINPVTAILAVLVWMVRKQQATLENLITVFTKDRREVQDSLDGISAMIRQMSEGGGSLNRDQSIRLFYRLSDAYFLRMCNVADEALKDKTLTTDYQRLRNYIIEMYQDEMRKFVADTRAFEYKKKALSEFANSCSRRWQYTMDEIVNRIWLYSQGDKTVDVDFESFFDRLRSRLQGSFNTWMDNGTTDTDTFEREFEQRTKAMAGEVEYLRDRYER